MSGSFSDSIGGLVLGMGAICALGVLVGEFSESAKSPDTSPEQDIVREEVISKEDVLKGGEWSCEYKTDDPLNGAKTEIRCYKIRSPNVFESTL